MGDLRPTAESHAGEEALKKLVFLQLKLSIQRIRCSAAHYCSEQRGAREVQRVPYSFSISTDYSGESKQLVVLYSE
jgi:hypothetical protein